MIGGIDEVGFVIRDPDSILVAVDGSCLFGLSIPETKLRAT